jgi:hypothetical protein
VTKCFLRSMACWPRTERSMPSKRKPFPTYTRDRRGHGKGSRGLVLNLKMNVDMSHCSGAIPLAFSREGSDRRAKGDGVATSG